MAWKRVYVKGKGYRWTDGKGNYRYDNPALKEGVKSAAGAVKGELKKIGRGYGKAAARTGERLAAEEKARVESGFGATNRFKKIKAEAAEAAKPKPKPKPTAAKPTPAKSTTAKATPSKSTPAKTTSVKPTPSKPKAKPTATASKPKKPMEKAYGSSGKELYMASKKNNPLMQRTFGYQTGEGPGQKKKETTASKKGSTSPSSAVKKPSKSSPKPQNFMSLSERRKKKRGY